MKAAISNRDPLRTTRGFVDNLVDTFRVGTGTSNRPQAAAARGSLPTQLIAQESSN
jgi:hypothetical protein